jgi:hypothetical protein
MPTSPKRIFFVGAPAGMTVKKRTALESLARTGGNTGNLLIGTGARKHLDYLESSEDLSLGAEFVRDNFDIIVVAAANFLSSSFDFGSLAEFIEKTGLPCCAMGLGVQAPAYKAPPELTIGTERFVRVLSERCRRMGVRGIFTANYLHDLGIKNVEPLGCPSLFINDEFELTIETSRLEKCWTIGVNGSHQSHEHSQWAAEKRATEQKLFRAAWDNRDRWYYMFQDEADEIALLEGSLVFSKPEENERWLKLWNHPGPASALLEYFSKYGKTFYSVQEWFQFVNKFDLVVGTRLHGIIAASQVRTPFLLFTHDSRTTEVADLFSIPSIHVTQATKMDLSRSGIKDLARAQDYSLFERRRRELLLRFRALLDDHGLAHDLYYTPHTPPGFRKNWKNCS